MRKAQAGLLLAGFMFISLVHTAFAESLAPDCVHRVIPRLSFVPNIIEQFEIDFPERFPSPTNPQFYASFEGISFLTSYGSGYIGPMSMIDIRNTLLALPASYWPYGCFVEVYTPSLTTAVHHQQTDLHLIQFQEMLGGLGLEMILP
jgi:hypothetical protein